MSDSAIADTPSPEAAPAAEGGTSTPAPEGSAISSAGGEAATFSQSLPEKFQVFTGEGDDKTIDLEASGMKVLESYNQLEGKLRDRDAPPGSAEDYKIDGENLGEGFDSEAFMKDEGTQSFLKSMHAKGLNNEQVQAVIEYGLTEWAPNLVQGSQELSEDQAVHHMKTEVWQDRVEYKENMQAANRAYSSLPQELQAQVNQQIGNDPTFLQAMAIFGKEMGEDTPANNIQPTTPADRAEIETLMSSEAYKDPKHPEHAVTSQKVQAYFKKQTKGK